MIDKHEEDTDHIGRLLRLAGSRETVPPERAMRVRAAVRDDWRRHTRARPQQITIAWSLGALATAALVLIGVRLGVRHSPPIESPGPAIATVEHVSGPVVFQIGDSIPPGSAIDTGTGGRAALRMAGGVVVRVDIATRLQLVSATALVLDHGAIYVDSGTSRDPGAIEVRTKLGVARDIGTRFEVRLDGPALRVRVRDGLVQLTRGRESHDAKAGDELTLNEKGGLVRRTVPVYGPDWAWAAALARPFELEGRSLREFLDWISADNGWQLRFAHARVEQKAATATLHGSIQGLTPEEALSAVLPTAGVEHELDNGVLTIRLSPSETTR